MVVERVKTGLNLTAGDRFFVLYGSHTSDHFCTRDLLIQDIEQVLHRYFQESGYERIVFYSGVNKLYFLDSKSRDRCRPQTESSSSPQNQSNQNQLLATSGGPLGKKRRLLRKKSSATTHQRTDQRTAPRLQDIQILSLLETIMQDTSHSSVIIFSNAEDLNSFDNRRELFGRIVQWSQLPPNNPNCCVFISHHDQRTRLQEFFNRVGFTFLANLISEQQSENSQKWNIHRLSSPTGEEIANLQHYFRLIHQKPVDWKSLDKLAVWLSAENQSLNYWYNRFKATSKLSLEQARHQQWLSGNVSTQPALERLQAMTGLHSVKELIRRRISVLKIEQERKKQGIFQGSTRLHLVFKGNPGTGKTTVARLIGEIYRDLGLLRRGHLVETGGRDLVAGYVGQTASQTNGIIDQAIDGVLFIDEAYTLNQDGENGFGQEAINTLLQRMENDRERLAVIVAGYPQQMEAFIHSNPGLERRFPTQVIFEDYTPEELLTIFKQKVSEIQCNLAPELEKELRELLIQHYQNREQNFGNAGFIENLFTAMDEQRSLRVSHQNLDSLQEPFQPEDIPSKYQFSSPDQEECLEELLKELDNLIGLAPVKQMIREIINNQLANQRLKEEGVAIKEDVETRHMIFTGNPGTGKTTIARLVGRIFKALGLLRKGHFLEAGRPDLVAGYVGQTALKTQEKIDQALDGVLFIDEAYALSRSHSGQDFGQEAIDTLVPAMENQRDRFIVILAGYSKEMEQFIATNSGLASRIAYEIHFPDYTAEELITIFLKMCQSNQRICSPTLSGHLKQIFQLAIQQGGNNFGNGRYVRNFYEEMVRKQKNRLIHDNLTGEAMMTFLMEDIP